MSSLTSLDPTSPDAAQVLYAPLTTSHELVTAAAVSPSGQFLAVGTSGGAVGQYVRFSNKAIEELQHESNSGDGMKSTQLFRVNEVRVRIFSVRAMS